MRKLFEAYYDGRCNECGGDIYQGDDIGYNYGTDGVVCQSCWEADEDEDSSTDRERGWL